MFVDDLKGLRSIYRLDVGRLQVAVGAHLYSYDDSER